MSTAPSLSAAVFLFLIPVLLILVVFIFYFYSSLKKREKEIIKEREESTRHLYELAILKELGERTGYSLNVEEILQIITGSLRQFIDYTAVGYVVITPEKLKINTHIEKPVSNLFIKEMKDRMVASLSALTNKSLDTFVLDEIVSGAIVVDEIKQSIGSLFNIPIVIGGKVVGVLSVAHIDPGLYKEADMTILYKITGQASEAVTRLEDVVKMEKGKLNAMVESMEDGVLMVDPEYRIVVANPAVKKIIKFSLSADEGKDINIFDFVNSLGGKFDIHGRLEEALVNKHSFVSDRINIGDSFFNIGVYPVLHSPTKGGSQMLGAVAVWNDITRDIELERVREEFTGMIVHELRSPLDGIKKIIELAVSGSVDKNSDQFREYLNMVHQSSSSMLELVNDILDLSKLQSGKFEVNKEEANIKEVVANRISFYKISADTRGVALVANLNHNLPELSLFDPQAIKQILNNFLSNALKFTKNSGSVVVSAFVYDPLEFFPKDLDKSKIPVFPETTDINVKTASLCVVVSDTGLGIPEDSMKDLFHTFKQARLNPVDKESKGTGLGLVIAKGIVEAHGGEIGVVSKEGMGTSFFFTIPL
ncbi:MAG: PAS sensor protein [Parcubacteria group bacterium GW2011_GWA1_38_7]|nr:MAG: PAS sensor protein [Parcubacteria group bacterium GW2011_GWA1_38_7]